MSIPQHHVVLPPTDGSVTLPETVDFHRKHNPTVPIYVFRDDGAAHITEITHLEFGRACDRVAHYVRPGRRGPDRQVVAVMALSDSLLYQTMVLGIMRAGFIPYPMSPRNTVEASVKLLRETSCHRILVTRTTLKYLIDEIQDKLAFSHPGFLLSIEEAPLLFDIYPNLSHEKETDAFEPYPAGCRPPLDEICAYVHSSGSAGFSKSIPQTFRVITSWATFPITADFRDQHRRLTFATQPLPCFHLFGFGTQLLVTLYGLVTASLYPPIATARQSLPMQPTPQNAIEHTKRTNCTVLYAIPAWVQIWAQDPQVVDYLATLDSLVYGGGPLPSKVGDGLVAAGVRLLSIYGGTEFGMPTHFLKGLGDKNDWAYTSFSPLVNTRLDDQGDGSYELQLLTCDTHRVAIENLPDVKGYATADLLVPHPSKPGLWKIIGRKDDLIIHTSGEKTVPAPIENVLMSSPHIIGALMFGRERDQPGVLIELEAQHAIDINDEQQVVQARNFIWPIVEEANEVAPSFSRIYKEFIIFVSKDRPLPRAGKGTVMRKAALDAYAKEIDDIYTEVETVVKVDNIIPPSSWLLENVESWLISQVTEIQSNRYSVSATPDLFEQGLDSLGATILRRRVVGALQSSPSPSAARLVTGSTVYANSSISKLARFIVGAVTDPGALTLTTGSKVDEIERMIKKFSSADPIPTSSRNNNIVVLITGTTGNLGAQLVDVFLRDGRVKRVYALNRPSSGGKDIKTRHKVRFVDKGLDLAQLSDGRLVFLEGDASSANLGLSSVIYDEIRDSVNVIIHNAWRLDFNLSLASFESNIRGTQHLIEFARKARQVSSLRFLFTSSVATANSWDHSKGSYPEDLVSNPEYAIGSGYGESKYVSERILAKSHLQVTSFRIGQISGGLPNGAWATTDWVPIVVKSSLALGAFPSATGVVSWLPMHAVAQILLDVALSTCTETEPALNVVHPRPVLWDTIISAINDALVQYGILTERLPILEFPKWFELLETRSREDSSTKFIEDVPAIKLIEFFRRMASVDKITREQGTADGEVGGQPKFATERAQTISETMKQLPLLGKEDAALWVKYWKCVGLFTSFGSGSGFIPAVP